MIRIQVIAITVVLFCMYSSCYAGCNCEDWAEKGGYCVDYVKSKIPIFPIPQNTNEIIDLKNKDIAEVTEGDVAIFKLSNYWHVAYVEEVQRNQNGDAIAIDIEEMNFGDQMSFAEFKSKWKSKSESEWKRALCCGITDNYDQASSRNNVALNTVKQIWSPDTAESESANGLSGNEIVGKAREVINRLIQFTGREL